MSLQRNYYEVLGLPPGATTDQIKKKYRELARRFHPDVAQDKGLSQLTFTQINQAYNTLSNPERRAQYNGTLQNAAAPPPVPPAQSPARNGATANPSAAQNGASAANGTAANGTAAGRAAANGTTASRPAAPTGAPPQAAASKPGLAVKPQAFTEMLSRAENAIMAGKPVEARAFCVRILEADPRHVRALEILGDALVQMGRQEEAAVQYRQALQVAPSSLIQAKLNRAAPAPGSSRTLPPGQSMPKPGGGQKTNMPSGGADDAEKPGGLLGRLLGRK